MRIRARSGLFSMARARLARAAKIFSIFGPYPAKVAKVERSWEPLSCESEPLSGGGLRLRKWMISQDPTIHPCSPKNIMQKKNSVYVCMNAAAGTGIRRARPRAPGGPAHAALAPSQLWPARRAPRHRHAAGRSSLRESRDSRPGPGLPRHPPRNTCRRA